MIPAMVRKRPHTKSRTGCDGCKKRRVKCDETRPNCSNCTLRELECHFSRPPSAPRSFASSNKNYNPETHQSVSPGANSISPGASIPGEASTDVNQSCYSQSTRLRELELMQQWCTKTCHSFTNELAQVFRCYIAKEAIKHEFLMDSLLALTSLHLASESNDPDAVASYVSSALQYQNNALPAFYTALRNITPSNCDAVFGAAIITMASSIVSPSLPTGNNNRLESTTENILLLLDYIRGIGSVVEFSRQWIESGPLNILLNGNHRVANGMENKTIVPIQHLRQLNDDVTGNTSPYLHEIYERAIAQLEVCFVINKNMAITWLVVAGKEFVNEFRNGELMAQLIFMYLGVLLDRLHDMWWARHSGQRLVEELAGNLLNQGGEWATATRWAMAQVGCADILTVEKDDRARLDPTEKNSPSFPL